MKVGFSLQHKPSLSSWCQKNMRAKTWDSGATRQDPRDFHLSSVKEPTLSRTGTWFWAKKIPILTVSEQKWERLMHVTFEFWPVLIINEKNGSYSTGYWAVVPDLYTFIHRKRHQSLPSPTHGPLWQHRWLQLARSDHHRTQSTDWGFWSFFLKGKAFIL